MGSLSFAFKPTQELGTGDLGLADEDPPATDASQHYPSIYALAQESPINLEKEFFFYGTTRECL
jgi:hypothetical protein